MPVQVIVLNGGSSSGKTAIARCLQAVLPQPWISLSVDDLVAALPPSLAGAVAGIAFGQRGMAAAQAETVHRGVVYDIEIDTSHTESFDCARAIAARVV
jgi:chloramphenicol 3-O-phosphotransferase